MDKETIDELYGQLVSIYGDRTGKDAEDPMTEEETEATIYILGLYPTECVTMIYMLTEAHLAGGKERVKDLMDFLDQWIEDECRRFIRLQTIGEE